MKNKFIKKLICFISALTLLVPGLVCAKPMATDLGVIDRRGSEGWPSAPSLSAESAYAIEINSGQVLLAKDENSKRFPASITKVMTALLVVENCNLDDMVTFSQEAFESIDITGANGNYKVGETMTVKDCLCALMLESINEMGAVLAIHTAGSIEAFADMMNARAEELGCTNTYFTNPHGLNDDEHLTSAHDMALIMWAAVLNETVFEIMSTKNYSVPKSDSTEGHDLTNHHKMLIPGTNYYYSKAIAGKTGYTSDAGNTLVTYGESEGIKVVVVVLKESNAGDSYHDTEAILDYAFNNFKYKDLSGEINAVIAGIESEFPYKLVVNGESSILLPDTMDDVTLSFEKRADGDEPEIVGKILIKSGDTVISTKNLVFEKGVEETEAVEAIEETAIEVSDSNEGGFWSSFLSVIKVIFIIILIIILLVFIYWFVIQLLKRNRAKKRREYLAKKNRIERIKKLRQNKDEGFDDDL